MKKKWIGMLLAGTLVGLSCSGCGTTNDSTKNLKLETVKEAAEDTNGVVKLTLWGAKEDQKLLGTIVENFKKQYEKETSFDITVEAVGEAECKKTILGDVGECADVFTFADDQLMALAAAGVLKPVENADSIRKRNLEGAVEAASIEDNLYAYPLTADNGYFMYYNKSYFKNSDLQTLDDMLKVATNNNKKIVMDWNSGWYLYSFFGNTGMEVGLGDDGVTNICNWNSKEGDIKGTDVAKAMLDIGKNTGFQNGADDDLTEGAKNGNVIAGVSGVWLSGSLKEAWGDNFGAVKLPTYTCAGKQVQMGSYVGYKMVGVNAYSGNTKWAAKLAEWLSNEENQTLRFQERGQGPANKNASETDEVKNDLAIKALLEQSNYGSLQRIGGKYWDPVAAFGMSMADGRTEGRNMQEIMDKLVSDITAIG